MAEIRNIVEDDEMLSYITVISKSRNNRYFVRTIPDIYDYSNVRTIVYKQIPNNSVAVELVNWSREKNGYIKSGSHDPVVSFIAENFDNLKECAKLLNIDFQETQC